MRSETIRDDYDFIFIDCPPSLGLLTLNALTAADSVLIPVQCEYYALEGLGQLLNTINMVKKQLNERLDIEGVLLTMFDSRLRLSNQIVEEVKKYFGDKVVQVRRHAQRAAERSAEFRQADHPVRCRLDGDEELHGPRAGSAGQEQPPDHHRLNAEADAMSKMKPVLGRGLASLIPRAAAVAAGSRRGRQDDGTGEEIIATVPVDQHRPEPVSAPRSNSIPSRWTS